MDCHKTGCQHLQTTCVSCGRIVCEKILPKNEWISVKDGLPKDGEYVLVYHFEDDHITVGYYESDNVNYYIESNGSKFYTDSGWETEIPWAQKGGVTHWMPLPETPKTFP